MNNRFTIDDEITPSEALFKLGQFLNFDMDSPVYLGLNLLIDEHEAIARVRELHKPVKSLFGFVICKTCLKDFPTEYPSTYSVVPYPCPTIQALDGEQ